MHQYAGNNRSSFRYLQQWRNLKRPQWMEQWMAIHCGFKMLWPFTVVHRGLWPGNHGFGFGLEHHPCFSIICLTIWICIGCEALSSSFGCGAPYGLISRSAGKVFSLKCFLLIDVHDDPNLEFSKMGGAATSWAPREHPKDECLKWRCGPSQVTRLKASQPRLRKLAGILIWTTYCSIIRYRHYTLIHTEIIPGNAPRKSWNRDGRTYGRGV